MALEGGGVLEPGAQGRGGRKRRSAWEGGLVTPGRALAQTLIPRQEGDSKRRCNTTSFALGEV